MTLLITLNCCKTKFERSVRERGSTHKERRLQVYENRVFASSLVPLFILFMMSFLVLQVIQSLQGFDHQFYWDTSLSLHNHISN